MWGVRQREEGSRMKPRFLAWVECDAVTWQRRSRKWMPLRVQELLDYWMKSQNHARVTWSL